MSYRLLAHVYDWVAPHISRYRSPGLVAEAVLELAPTSCDLLDVGIGTGLSVRRVAALLKPGGYFVFTYEPELPSSRWQSKTAPHIGTFGREPVFRRTPEEIQTMLKLAGLVVMKDIPFKAYLGLVHHLVLARA